MAHLSSVRLRGFKTFARPTELLLQPGITVVIGPNGSGKSNIADAVLWVLGEQSPANLRGRSMQDVLFTGPDGRRSSAVAEVSLTFDNECGSLPLDCAQVEITRRIVRDGGSEYRLNGSVCRLLDVQDLMGGLGLGREMHSVISQGKVEALLNSTPEARRALVEEAAGLGRFKKRRERARAKLDRTRQNLLRVSDIEAEVKKSLRPLRQQAAAAERFAQAMEEWASARARLLVFDLAASAQAKRGIEETLARSSARRTEVEARLAALRRQRADEEEQFSAALREREDLSAAFHRIRSEHERLEARAVVLRQRVARNEGEMDRARRRRELAAGELQAYEARLLGIGGDTTNEDRLQRVAGIASDLRGRLEAATPAYREALRREDEAKDGVFELEAARSRALQDREYLKRELEERRRLAREVDELLQTAKSKTESLDQEARSGGEEISKIEEVLLQTRQALAEALSSREDARAREEEVRREEAGLAERSVGLDSRRAVLDDILRRRAGMSSGALEVAGKGADSRLLTEVLGVEPGCERALAAALGLVVQAVALAGAVDLEAALRGEGPREVIWGRRGEAGGEPGRQEGAGPGAVPPGMTDLWEMVTGPEPVVRTLKALIPPTAVAPIGMGLEEIGRAQGLEGWRVVTRSGELMTAGLHVARRTEEGAEALLRARNEMVEVEAEKSRVTARIHEVRQSAGQAASAAKEAEEKSKACEEESRHAERRLLTIKNEVDLRARRVEEAAAQVKELTDRSAREAASISQMEEDLKAAETLVVVREADLETARNGLVESQTRLESLRRDVNRVEEKKSQAALLEVRLRERCRAHENECRRVQSQRDAAARDLDKTGRRLQLAADYAPHLAALLDVVERLADRAGRVARELEGVVEQARSRSESAARIIRDWGGAEAELQGELEESTSKQMELQVESARLDERRSTLEEELADLRRRHLAPRNIAPADVAGEDRQTLESALERADQRKERIGPVNPLAEQECAEMEERARFLGEQRRDLEASIAQLQDVITELDDHINGSFDGIFGNIRENFAAVIATVFPGAKGMLALTEKTSVVRRSDSEDDEQDDEAGEVEAGGEPVRGISLSVKFPNKAPRSMSLLSGGEKAMTAIAFLFSLFLAKPCPFYILDEVEASLDDVNIRRFLSLIRKYRDRTQFIVITHQRQTMEVADTLYGVALEPDGTSRVLSRRLADGGGARVAAGEVH